VQVLGGGDQLVARPRGAEHVQLHLHGREAVPGWQAAKGLPRADGVGERDPGTPVDDAARVQVAPIDDHAPDEALVRCLHRLHPHVAGQAALDPLPNRLDRDERIRLGHRGAVNP
jgi:hypothetical protein